MEVRGEKFMSQSRSIINPDSGKREKVEKKKKKKGGKKKKVPFHGLKLKNKNILNAYFDIENKMIKWKMPC